MKKFPALMAASQVYLTGNPAAAWSKDLVVYNVAASLEAGHDAGVGWDAVAVFPCLEGLD